MKAFTLVESLVVIAMIATMTLVMTPFYQSSRAQLSLDRSASKLAQDVRSILEKAMSAQDYPACGSSYEYGYGIYLDSNTVGSYKLFADCNNNGSYQPSDEEIEQVYFEYGVAIESLSRNNSYVIFEPPDPEVLITSGDSSVTIILKSVLYPERKRTININKVGLVDID